MAIGSGQIDQAALSQQIEPAVVGELILGDVVLDLILLPGHLLQGRDIDLHIEVAAVGDDCLILHKGEVLFS